MRNYVYGLISGLLLCAFGVATVYWQRYMDHTALIATPVKAIAGKKTEPIHTTEILAYPGEVKKSLHLPKTVVINPVEHVTAAVKISPSKNPTVATAVINAITGKTEIFTYREPLRWLAFNRQYSIGADYLARYDAAQAQWKTEGRQYIRVDFMQVKSLNFGAVYAHESDGSQSFGVGLHAEW